MHQGGFLPDASHTFDAQSPNTDSPSKKGSKSGSANQSLRPVTILQLMNAFQPHADDVFKVDNQDIAQITFVGKILTITEQETNINFSVDDGTSIIDVKLWLDSEDKNDFNAQKKSSFREGLYVRVNGSLRSFQQRRSVVAFRLLPVTDFNELTYHLLEVTYVHLYFTKGARSTNGNTNTSHQQNAYSNDSFGNQNSYMQPYQQQQQQSYQQQSYQQPQQFSSLTSLHSGIIQLINSTSAGNKTGAAVDFLCKQLNQSEANIRSALDFLVSEGHVYGTIDDDHYQTTNN